MSSWRVAMGSTKEEVVKIELAGKGNEIKVLRIKLSKEVKR